MKQPIKLYIPHYYDVQKTEGHRLLLSKTKPLLKEDANTARYIASIERVENYQCNITEIGEEYQKIATNCFHRDREKNWELQTKVSGCKVYTYNWDANDFHFRIYWIMISEKQMLQLVGICEPKHSGFYKKHFMLKGLDTEIYTAFDFLSENNPSQLFECIPVEIDIEELQEQIDTERQKENKAKFLEENLTLENPNFYSILEAELKEKEEASIDSFMCTDWNMYYDLFNPENFSDPDSTIEWEDNADVFEYYEQPYTDNTKVTIVDNDCYYNEQLLKNLVNNTKIAEQNLLSFFEYYTFGNGGAYADAQHYKWAKIEIERLHNTTYTNQEFLKRNLCLQDIIFTKNPEELKLYFKCSWDTEHGIDVIINEKMACKIEL